MRHEVRGRRPNDVSIPSGTLYIHRTNTSRWQLQGQILTSNAVVAFLRTYVHMYVCIVAQDVGLQITKSDRSAWGSVSENVIPTHT